MSILSERGIKVDGFIVTDERVNKKVEAGLNVIGIENFSFDKDNMPLVIIAVKPPWNEEIFQTLKDKGITGYLDAIPELPMLNDKPNLFEITTCIGCKVACQYCPQSVLIKRYEGEHMMSFETFKTAIDKIPTEYRVAFSGFSEPFLNPEATNMILYAADRGHKILLATTLVGLKQEQFERIKNVPFERVTLHIPDVEGRANIPITDEYVSLLKRVVAWKKNGNGKEMQSVIRKANCQGTPHPRVAEIMKGKVLLFSELADRAGNLEVDDNLYSVEKRLKGSIYCSYSKSLNNMVMLPNGSVYLCCMDFGLQHRLGNIIKQDFEELRNSDELESVRRAMKKDNGDNILCRYCTEARLSSEK